MAKYPPYVNAYGKISKLFSEIKKAAVPPKFTQDFLTTILGLTSSSFRAMIPLLKNIGFLDAANIPTQAYKDFRDDSISGQILADKVKEAYADLYKAHEYAHKLSKDELTSKLKTLLGVGDEDLNLRFVVGTFQELVKLSDFDGKSKKKAKPEERVEEKKDETKMDVQTPLSFDQGHRLKTAFGISYTINLNLPATTEIEVYNSIFKAIKEHLLNE